MTEGPNLSLLYFLPLRAIKRTTFFLALDDVLSDVLSRVPRF